MKEQDKTKLSGIQKKILLLYAENDMKLERVKRKLFYARGTLDYYLDQIRVKTGIDPRTFYGLAELVQKVNKGEL